MSEKRKRRRKEKQAERKTNFLDLPSDVLLLILNRIDHDERLSLSLVSKSFRSITDGFVHKLKFNHLTSNSAFRKLFSRFTSVNLIVVEFSKRIDHVLIAISRSQLQIEELEIHGTTHYPKLRSMIRLAGRFTTVKVLKLNKLIKVVDLQVVEFINLFQFLEVLDLSGCKAWSDVGIEKLASSALYVRKINLNGNKCLTDRSLHSLANCVDLERISFEGCNKITVQGFYAFMCKRNNLKSLEMPSYFSLTMKEDDTRTLAETISLCGNLSHLSINKYLMKDVFLRIIANSCSPLMSLKFTLCRSMHIGYTMTGLSAMIRAFQGLTRLHVSLPWAGLDTQDKEMSQLVKSLPNLKDVHISSCHAAYATLFSLIHNCLLLESIKMKFVPDDEHYYAPPEHYYAPPLIRKNYSVQHINLFPEPASALKIALKSVGPSLKIFMCNPFSST